MIKLIFVFLWVMMAVQNSVAQTEELSGPPAVFAVETHDNLEDDVLPFLEMEQPTDIEAVSTTSSENATAMREVIESSDFVATVRFVNRRSNRIYDMVYDSAEIEKQKEADSFIQALSEEASESVSASVAVQGDRVAETDSDAVLEGLHYKSLNVQVKQCIQDYEGVYGNDTAFVEVKDVDSLDVLYSGWIYKKRPSVHVFEHPTFSMYLISCK